MISLMKPLSGAVARLGSNFNGSPHFWHENETVVVADWKESRLVRPCIVEAVGHSVPDQIY